MNSKKLKRLLLNITRILLISVLISLVYFETSFEISSIPIFANNTSLLSEAIFFLAIIIIALFIYISFYLKFRFNSDSYDFNVIEYKKDRADLEEKIRQLQKAINNNVDSWSDNNHLAISGQVQTSTPTGIVDFQSILQEQFGVSYKINPIPQTAFMLMPFNRESVRVYDHCRQTFKRNGFKLCKSDDEFIEGDLLKSIVAKIVESEIIIANLDGKNPNVFYELGISHTLGKKTILITSYNPEEMPFDVKNKFIIFYQSISELDEKLTQALMQLSPNTKSTEQS